MSGSREAQLVELLSAMQAIWVHVNNRAEAPVLLLELIEECVCTVLDEAQREDALRAHEADADA